MHKCPKIILSLLLFLLPYFIFSQENIDKHFTVEFSIENEVDLTDYFNWWDKNKDNISTADEIAILKKSIDAATAFELDSMICIAQYQLGLLYLYEGEMSDAFPHLQESLSYRDKINDPVLFAWINNALGLVYEDAGEREEALEAFFTSYKDFIKANSSFVTYPLGNISDIYKSLDDKTNAIKYTLEAVKYTKQLEGHHYAYNYGYDCTALSKLYDDIAQADSALIYLERSLDQIAGLDVNLPHSDHVKFEIYENAFSYYLKRKKYNQAKMYLSLAKEVEDDKTNLILLEGAYYLATNQKEKLLDYFESNVVPDNNFEIHKKYLGLKKEAYQKYGYFEKALDMADSMTKLDKEQHVKEKEKYAVFADAKFENLKKVKIINELEKERNLNQLTIQKQKAYQLAGLAGIVSTLLLAFFIFYRYQQKNIFSKKLQLEVDQKTESLQKVNSNLANKNTELRRFNYIISHDLKEPLRSIVSFSNILQKKSLDNPVFQEYTGYIINAGKQLFSLVEDIKKFQDIDHMLLKKEEINLMELMDELTAILSNYLKENNALVTYEKLPTISHARSAIFLIAKNIIENGIKYNQQKVPTIKITCHKVDQDFHLSFKDNGIGIEKEYFDQIFIMFKRLHNRSQYEGSGIGLAFAQKVARQMKSLIVISNSEMNIGTTFTLIIKPLEISSRLEVDNTEKRNKVISEVI